MGKKKGTNGMMKKITKRLWEKKNSKKGFTLVELIVVLVILAILAALMVPALTGWIEKAKEKQVALEARSAYLATQTLLSTEYGEPSPDRSKIKLAAVLELAELEDQSPTIYLYYKSNGTDDTKKKEYFTLVGLRYVNGDLSANIGNVNDGTGGAGSGGKLLE